MSKLKEKILCCELKEYINKALGCIEHDLECDVILCYLSLRADDVSTIVHLERCVEVE